MKTVRKVILSFQNQRATLSENLRLEKATKKLMILIHEDVLQRLHKMLVLFWIALITSGFRIYSQLGLGP